MPASSKQVPGARMVYLHWNRAHMTARFDLAISVFCFAAAWRTRALHVQSS
jgi:hypothetical protein